MTCKVADFGLSRELENDDADGAYWTKVYFKDYFFKISYKKIFIREAKYQSDGQHRKLYHIESLHLLQTYGAMVFYAGKY